MSNSLIIIYTGEYSNDDAYERVLSYVSNKNYVCGYAVPVPIERNSLIASYREANENSNYETSRYIWHFTISLPEISNLGRFMSVANSIAKVFAYDYQVLYSLDLATGHPHIHFAINNYSYHPERCPLSEDLFDAYIKQSLSILQSFYPTYKAKIRYQEGHYV